MATAKPPTSRPAPEAARPRLRKAGILLAVLAVALLAIFWSTLRSYAVAGAALGARTACSCRYVGGRELASCRKDFEPGMGLVTLSEDADAKSVTARFPMLARETATFRQGEGCLLERWRG